MKTFFKQQLESNMPVTEQILSELKCKKYYSGKNIEIGEIVLYALLNKGILSESRISLELITLNQNEFELYSVDEKANNADGIPTVKLK